METQSRVTIWREGIAVGAIREAARLNRMS
jgi:hypothetical protein